jgi:hypothetical protein
MFLMDLLREKDRSLEIAAECDEAARAESPGVPGTEISPRMHVFWSHYGTISDISINCLSCEISGDDAIAQAAVGYTGLLHGCCDPIRTTGRADVKLKRSPYGGWDVIQASVPGIVM